MKFQEIWPEEKRQGGSTVDPPVVFSRPPARGGRLRATQLPRPRIFHFFQGFPKITRVPLRCWKSEDFEAENVGVQHRFGSENQKYSFSGILGMWVPEILEGIKNARPWELGCSELASAGGEGEGILQTQFSGEKKSDRGVGPCRFLKKATGGTIAGGIFSQIPKKRQGGRQ